MAPSRARPRPRARAAATLLVLLAPVTLGGACTKRTDARIREAWGGGSKAADRGANGGSEPSDERSGDTDAAPVRVGWDRLDEILDGALAEASLGTDEEVIARLAERWCDVQPEAKPTAEGPVLVCFPRPPVEIDGHRFSLELGGEGVIGLVASELSLEDSSTLADEALRRTERWCTRPWNDVSPRPTEPPPAPSARLHTCPVEGSALLVVGRFVPMGQADLWQVSVAVIDAS